MLTRITNYDNGLYKNYLVYAKSVYVQSEPKNRTFAFFGEKFSPKKRKSTFFLAHPLLLAIHYRNLYQQRHFHLTEYKNTYHHDFSVV